MLAQVPGGVTEGLFAAAGWSDLAARAEQVEPAAFIAVYTQAHGEFPGTGALLGYSFARGFTGALEKAGRDLTVDSLLAAMESLDFYDPLMDIHVDYAPDDHQGADEVVLSVVEGGRMERAGASGVRLANGRRASAAPPGRARNPQSPGSR